MMDASTTKLLTQSHASHGFGILSSLDSATSSSGPSLISPRSKLVSSSGERYDDASVMIAAAASHCLPSGSPRSRESSSASIQQLRAAQLSQRCSSSPTSSNSVDDMPPPPRCHHGRFSEAGRQQTSLSPFGQSERLASFLIKDEVLTEHDSAAAAAVVLAAASSSASNPLHQMVGSILQSSLSGEPLLQMSASGSPIDASSSSLPGGSAPRLSHTPRLMRHLQIQPQQPPTAHLFSGVDLSGRPSSNARQQQHLHYSPNSLGHSVVGADCIATQKVVAFLAGPRERIHVLGNPVEHCPRCQHEGLGTVGWRPHRHIGELKIRYICERHFDDLESNHHFDIPLCPVCNQVLYLYDFNNMLGVSNARRLHKYVLKCANRHVLPLLDLFCQTKKSGERCNANFKLQWCYGTMVKRCEAQKNRDHDLWWVRYKNEWKQRRTIIRYKKDFLSHLTDAQRSLLLGLGLEGEPPPDPKSVLGATFDVLLSSVGGSLNGPKIKKRTALDRNGHQDRLTRTGSLEPYEMNPAKQQRYRSTIDYAGMADYSAAVAAATAHSPAVRRSGTGSTSNLQQQRTGAENTAASLSNGTTGTNSVLEDPSAADALRYVMGAVVLPTRTGSSTDENQIMVYLRQQQQQQTSSGVSSQRYSNSPDSPPRRPSLYVGTANEPATLQPTSSNEVFSSSSIITGTPTAPLPSSGISPVAVSVVGEVIPAPVIA